MKKLILTVAIISASACAFAQTSKVVSQPDKKPAEAAKYHTSDTVVVKYGKRLESYIITGTGYTNHGRQIFYDCVDLYGKQWYRLPERAIVRAWVTKLAVN